jgi:hypothetical protein
MLISNVCCNTLNFSRFTKRFFIRNKYHLSYENYMPLNAFLKTKNYLPGAINVLKKLACKY